MRSNCDFNILQYVAVPFGTVLKSVLSFGGGEGGEGGVYILRWEQGQEEPE